MRRSKYKNFGFIVFVILLFLPGLIIPANVEQLENRVKEAIVLSRLNESDIDIDVKKDGRVELEGRVETLYDKHMAFEIIGKVAGVTEISNQLVVEPVIVSDEALETDIRRELKINSAVREWENIDVTVKNYVVTLEGKISFYHEKIAADNIAAQHNGVMAVINNINVKRLENALSDKNLEKYLMTIVENQFPSEDNIHIKVDDGQVSITGEPHTLWSAYQIEEEFSNVIGVRDIDNYLVISN